MAAETLAPVTTAVAPYANAASAFLRRVLQLPIPVVVEVDKEVGSGIDIALRTSLFTGLPAPAKCVRPRGPCCPERGPRPRMGALSTSSRWHRHTQAVCSWSELRLPPSRSARLQVTVIAPTVSTAALPQGLRRLHGLKSRLAQTSSPTRA